MDTPRRDVAGHTLSNPCKKKGASIMVAAGLCIGLDGVGHIFSPYFIPPETKINTARYQDMLRSYYGPWRRRRSAVLTLSSNRTGPNLTQLVPLVFCLVRCSVKLWCGQLSRPICPRTTALGGVCGSLSSLRRTQRTPRRYAQPSSRPTSRSQVTRSSA